MLVSYYNKFSISKSEIYVSKYIKNYLYILNIYNFIYRNKITYLKEYKKNITYITAIEILTIAF